MLILIALLLGIAAGLMFEPGEWRAIRWRWFLGAIVAAAATPFLLSFWWELNLLPPNPPVQSWAAIAILMGLYQSAAFLVVNAFLPWAPFHTRAKASLAILSAAAVVGTYAEGDLLLDPHAWDLADRFVHATLFAAMAVLVGVIARRRYSIQRTL
jgi:hypothetical protein